jgi:hypothetical protein
VTELRTGTGDEPFDIPLTHKRNGDFMRLKVYAASVDYARKGAEHAYPDWYVGIPIPAESYVAY